MSKKTALFSAIIFLTIYTSTGLTSDLAYVPGELLVKFAPKQDGKQRSLTEKNQILTSLGGATIKHTYTIVPGLTLVKLPPAQTVKDHLQVYRDADGILYAEPNYRRKYGSTFPNDPNFAQLWGMHNIGQAGGTPDTDIDALEAWDIHTGSTDIIVAVLDSGVDYNHPDLAVNMWTNEAELNGDPNVDDDGNGYVDDVYGYDFGSGDGDPMDEHSSGHGTRCAGIIGAIGNNNEGLTGVCWNVKIMAVKISIGSSGPTLAAEVNGIEYAIQMGTNVLNLSAGGGESAQSEKDAIEAADANGLLFVTIADNYGVDIDSTPVYPASYDLGNIIAVMATDANDDRSIWSQRYSSNWGANSVDLAAPGSNIWSCVPEGGYKSGYGTSLAAPYVAGACALVWSVNPALSHYQVRDIILNNVDRIPALDGLCVTGGRLNLYKAIVEAANQGYVLTVADDVNEGDSVSPNDNVTYTISFDSSNLTNIEIVDYLPDEVNYPNSSDPNYDSQSHSYTWSIGPNDPNLLQLTVVVNNSAEPSGKIINLCFIDADEIEPIPATEITDVNCWGPGIVYVDCNATDGSNTGVSWQNAYVNLRCALERIHGGCGSEIRVAEGTYLGNFNVGNSTVTLRSTNPDDWCVVGNTIFRGSSQKELPIFDFNDSIGSVLNGFTITSGLGDGVRCVNESSVDITNCLIQNNGYDEDVSGSGVYIKKSSANIKNCKIQNNGFSSATTYHYGIICINSSLNITDCNIQNNATIGVYCKSNSSLTTTSSKIQNNHSEGIYCNDSNSNITRCIIKGNGKYGIHCAYFTFFYPTVIIMNNWIFDNGTSGSYHGIRFYDIRYTEALIRNNTIVNNTGYGIERSQGRAPKIINCVIWDNGDKIDDSLKTVGNNVSYSCIQGGYTGVGNIDTDPCFVNVNNYHLDPDACSPCIDAGDPNFTDYNETDIDGEIRIFDGDDDSNNTEIVDMGADEFYWSPADFDQNEIVNFLDYALFANGWQTGDPNYSLDGDSDVDGNDLDLFCEDWLWQPAWTDAEPLKMMGCGIDGGLDLEAIHQAVPAEQQTIEAEQIEAEEPDIETLKELVAFEEMVLEDEEVRELVGEDHWQEFYEGCKRIIDSINAEIAQMEN
jgi:hypothetical protein